LGCGARAFLLKCCHETIYRPLRFNGVKHPFHVYIGNPHPKKHPLQFQAWWLSSERGGTIPQDVMDSFEKLFKISQENNVSFEDLCVYALGTASKENNAASGGGTAAASGGGASGGGAPAAKPAVAAPAADPLAANPVPPPTSGD
jgi:hypothetical protein